MRCGRAGWQKSRKMGSRESRAGESPEGTGISPDRTLIASPTKQVLAQADTYERKQLALGARTALEIEENLTMSIVAERPACDRKGRYPHSLPLPSQAA